MYLGLKTLFSVLSRDFGVSFKHVFLIFLGSFDQYWFSIISIIKYVDLSIGF